MNKGYATRTDDESGHTYFYLDGEQIVDIRPDDRRMQLNAGGKRTRRINKFINLSINKLGVKIYKDSDDWYVDTPYLKRLTFNDNMLFWY